MGILTDSSFPDDGGRAFPSRDYGRGMSLRDWFAGQALAGFMTWSGGQYPANAKAFYAMADALIAERAAPIADEMRRRLVGALKSRRALPHYMLDGKWTSRDWKVTKARLAASDARPRGFCVLRLDYAQQIAAILSRKDRPEAPQKRGPKKTARSAR